MTTPNEQMAAQSRPAPYNEGLPTISERQANGRTADIYADIRSTMGVAVVNLIWRRLATSTAALEWCWTSLRPLYSSGAIPGAAWVLRRSVECPQLRPFNADELTQLGIAPAQCTTVNAVLRTYERGNAQNLVALCTLQSALSGRPSSATQAVPPPVAGSSEDSAEAADRVDRPLPPLPDLEELDPSARADIVALSAIWVPSAHRGLVPSVFRHLGHWPSLLGAFHARLQAAIDDGAAIDEPSRDAVAVATAHGAALREHLGRPAVLDAPTEEWLRNCLDLFINTMIGRGVIIVPAMRRALIDYPAPAKEAQQ